MTADHAINLVLLLSKYLHGSQLEDDFFFWRRKGQDPWPGRKAAGWGWISFNEAISGKHAAELRLRREYNVSLFCPLFLFFFPSPGGIQSTLSFNGYFSMNQATRQKKKPYSVAAASLIYSSRQLFFSPP